MKKAYKYATAALAFLSMLYFSVWSIQTAWLSVSCNEDKACLDRYSFWTTVQAATALFSFAVFAVFIGLALRASAHTPRVDEQPEEDL